MSGSKVSDFGDPQLSLVSKCIAFKCPDSLLSSLIFYLLNLLLNPYPYPILMFTYPFNHLLLPSNKPHSTHQNLCTPPLSLLPNGAHKPLAQNHAGSHTTQYHRAPIFLNHHLPYIQILYHHLSPLKSQRIAKTQRINLPLAWLVGPYHICT